MDMSQRLNQLNKLIRETIEVEQKEEKDHGFFYYDNAFQEKKTRNLKRKKKPYTSSRIKTRHFLLNISYNGVKDEDFYDKNFVFDTFILLTQNLNPFSLERKVSDLKNREIIYICWEECVEKSFYRHICQRENFLYSNGKNVVYPHSAEIVWNYAEREEENIAKRRKCLQKN